MIVIEKSENQIVLRGHREIAFMGIVALFMAGIGVQLLFELLPLEEDAGFGDVFGLIFMCLWISVVVWMCVYALMNGLGKTTISNEGISCDMLFLKRHVRWEQVRDWGLSYSGQSRGAGNTYDFYFSRFPQKVRNECRKKLRGKMIKIIVIGDAYDDVVREVIPFCRERTAVEPFIGADKFHFI